MKKTERERERRRRREVIEGLREKVEERRDDGR